MNGRRQTRPALRLMFIVVISFPLLIAGDVYGCQCREREPPCSQYKNADVVFVGSVVTITREEFGPRKKIVFSIEQNVKGLRSSTAELVSGSSSCDYSFSEGKTYLVYAYRNSERNELYTHYCTRTREISDAGSDLAFFKLINQKPQPSQIVGVLAENMKRLRDVNIVASSGGRNYRTTTDEEGWFRLNVPPSRKYQVRILLPLYADLAGTEDELNKITKRERTRTNVIIEYEVVVEPNSCAFVNPPLFIDYTEYQKHRGVRHFSRH